jgi:hypothetical protein
VDLEQRKSVDDGGDSMKFSLRTVQLLRMASKIECSIGGMCSNYETSFFQRIVNICCVFGYDQQCSVAFPD